MPAMHHPASVSIPPALADSVGYLLRLAHEWAEQCALVMLPPGQHPRDYAVLTTLEHRTATSQQNLAERLAVNRTIMVKLVDRLEAAGLVARRRNPTDRRSYQLVLTELGAEQLHGMRPAIDRGDQRATGHLTPGQRGRLAELLRRLLYGNDRVPDLPAELTARTGFLLASAHLRARELAHTVLIPVGITPRHYGAMALLAAGQPCTQQQVAEQLHVSATAVVQLVDDLEEHRLVERRPSRTDRRRNDLRLTDSGRDVLSHARAALDLLATELTAPLDPSSSAELNILLRALLGYPAAMAMGSGHRVGASSTIRSTSFR
ncbi:MarR family transcriptional regulator [Frankia sp. Cppng1_Ct_nod]|uniref:MarR family winged helix-turn-helix transcriptional regulator n=1 Tax=Frankia sp. Cppng1_Ct_nod TaxID=2897162 RepID=UPI001040F052|nr:MarR family transcriptional regulator [Frankia sp. Cppng1_Ct_nod]